jgi:hypothetical protein
LRFHNTALSCQFAFAQLAMVQLLADGFGLSEQLRMFANVVLGEELDVGDSELVSLSPTAADVDQHMPAGQQSSEGDNRTRPFGAWSLHNHSAGYP